MVGEKGVDSVIPGDYVSADQFAELVLGFEEVDENELEQAEDEAGGEYGDMGAG